MQTDLARAVSAIKAKRDERNLPHQLLWAPKSAQELLAGTTATGSAFCICGGWSHNALPNRAGQESSKASFQKHLLELSSAAASDLDELIELVDFLLANG